MTEVHPMNQTAEQMTGPSSEHLSALGEALNGTGTEAWAAYRSLTQQASSLPGIGQSVADAVAALRADTSLPRDHRYKLADEKRASAEIVITKLNEGANAAVAQLEGALISGLIPKPHHDTSQRSLHRQELANILGNKEGQQLADAARTYLGQNANHDAELLSDYGRSLFHGRGAGNHWPALQAAAVEKLSKATGGTERQIAARRALGEFKSRNIAGRVSAFRVAAQMHLTRDDA